MHEALKKKYCHKLLTMLIEATDNEDCMPGNGKESEPKRCYLLVLKIMRRD